MKARRRARSSLSSFMIWQGSLQVGEAEDLANG
jgi:hypothetical protein